MTTAELRTELRRRGLPTSYNKMELIRLMGSPETTEGVARPGLTDEHRAKISAAVKGRPMTDEHRAKISAARRESLETKFVVFFGDDVNHPLTVGLYGSRALADEALQTDVSSPWHEDQDFCMLYRGKPGGDLTFIKAVSKKEDV